MNRRSDSSSGCRRGVAQRFKLPISASQFAKSRHIKLAVALVFCSGASLLYAQEQSAAVISHEVKEIFERAGKAVVKIHGLDQHSPICGTGLDRKSTRLNSSHLGISYAVFCLKKK